MNPHHMKAAASMSAIVGGLGPRISNISVSKNNSASAALKPGDTVLQDHITVNSKLGLHA